MSFFDFFRNGRQSYRPNIEALEARDCPSVAAPASLQLTALSPTQVKLNWTNVAGENGYRIYQWNGTQAALVKTVSPNVTTFTINQLSANQLYYFSVEAYDSTTTGRTAWASARTLADTITAPTNVHINPVSTTQLTLTWNDATNETGYKIFGWDGSEAVQVGSVGANVVSFAIGNLTPGTVYYYYVQAFNATNIAASDWASGTTQTVSLTAPGNLRAQLVGSDKIQLNWNDAAGETGYRVYRWDASSSPVIIATLNANVTSYQSTGLQFGREYWYYVQAYNATAAANSAWVKATTPANLMLLPPANFAVLAAGTTSATLSWTDSAGAVGYRVYYWTGYGWGLMTVVPQGQGQTTISNLQPNHTHWFLLQAFTAGTQIANTAAMFVNL